MWNTDRWLLEWATGIWLVVPFVLFAAGWLRVWVAVPVVLVALAGLVRSAPRLGPAEPARPTRDDATRRRRWLAFGVAAVGVVGVVLYSGTGGYAHQFGGAWRNETFILDLSRYVWPLGFEDVGARHEPGVLAFYIANAIGPAAVGYVLGWDAAMFFQFLWTGVAVFLALCWFLRVVGDHAPQWVLVFFFFGGLDVVGYTALVGPLSNPSHELDLWTVYYSLRAPEMAGVFWIVPSNLTLLFNSPHHVLCSWIVLLVVLDDAIHRTTSRRVGLLVAFALLWSAFSFVGLAPFVLASLYWTRGREMWSFENLVSGVAVLGITLLYIGSNNGEYVSGPLWTFQDLGETGWVLALVYVLEFGVVAALVPFVAARRDGIGHPVWLGTVVVSLLLWPWYRIGDFNDFTTKAAVPAVLVLQLVVAGTLASRPWRSRLAAGALIALLVLGSGSTIVLLRRSVGRGLDMRPTPIDKVAPSNELARCSGGGQLFSDGRSFFWRVLARPVTHQPNRTDWPPAGGVPRWLGRCDP